jgi:hypothetical protein
MNVSLTEMLGFPPFKAKQTPINYQLMQIPQGQLIVLDGEKFIGHFKVIYQQISLVGLTRPFAL